MSAEVRTPRVPEAGPVRGDDEIDRDRRGLRYKSGFRAPATGKDWVHPLIENRRAEILALAERHGVRDVRVFGSMARGDADAGSDVDLLVSLAPGKTGLALGALLADVELLLGRRVEIVTEGGLHPGIRDRVLDEARPL